MKIVISTILSVFPAALHMSHIHDEGQEFATLLAFSTSTDNAEPAQPAHVDDAAVKSNLERQIAALDNSQAALSSAFAFS